MKAIVLAWDYAIPQTDAAAKSMSAEVLMDDEAFNLFYQRTARPLWAYLARVSGSSSLADDLLQESYLRFLCSGNRGQDEESRRRYLFRIASNLLRDHWRRPVVAALDELPEFAAPDGRDSERIDSQSILGPALAQMKPRERQLLWLAYAEGSTHREIAEITGLGAPSIRLLLFRARRKMARLLRQRKLVAGRNK
ncbi:MAG TPA: sigma-70 family RNA polymerase sigma factor [Candidatus Angelobacter sp.]|jgi:RNA polymerase sigma-70 factor (ECF subfamily)|nr:sigma-70 family RNA polymerase sigma factor [Candidatus Angelobacter sp.]